MASLIWPVAVAAPQTPIEYEDFLECGNKDPLMAATNHRIMLCESLNTPEVSLTNADAVSTHGEIYLKDLYALMDVAMHPVCTPKVVPLLSWRSGVKPDAKAFPNNVFKSFRDIVHFETLIVGITTASAKLGVAGFCSAFDQNTGEAEEGSLKRALDVCKEGASLFAYMVEFNGGLNCEPIRKLCPEVDPACLNCLKNYAKLCLSQISFEIARKKPREKLSSEMLAKLAAQNRIYAREVVGSVKPEFGKGMQSVQVHCSQYAACMDLTVNGLMMEQALNENKYGVAEAWAKRCQIDLQSLKNVRNNPVLKPLVDREVRRWEGLAQTVEADNNQAYFQPVPDDDKLPIVVPLPLVTVPQYDGFRQRAFEVDDIRLPVILVDQDGTGGLARINSIVGEEEEVEDSAHDDGDETKTASGMVLPPKEEKVGLGSSGWRNRPEQRGGNASNGRQNSGGNSPGMDPPPYAPSGMAPPGSPSGRAKTGPYDPSLGSLTSYPAAPNYPAMSGAGAAPPSSSYPAMSAPAQEQGSYAALEEESIQVKEGDGNRAKPRPVARKR